MIKKTKFKSLFEYYSFDKKDEKECPVVSKILRELTPEEIKKRLIDIKNIKLPLELKKWVKEYSEVGDRDPFIWKWAYRGWHLFTLSCVDKEYSKIVINSKFLNTILNTLLDDLADKQKNSVILRKTIKIILDDSQNKNKVISNFDKNEKKYILYTYKVWHNILRRIKEYPRFNDFIDIFRYDYSQFFNTIKYSCLINKKPYLINLSEHNIFSPHNMQGMIGLDLDLMCSKKFDIKESRFIREIILNAERMGRIGNLVTTWEKEIYQKDFTSGVFAFSLNENIIELNELKNSKIVIKKIKEFQVEKHFIKQWEKYYNNIFEIQKKVKTANIKEILIASKDFLIMHLISRGLEI